MKKPRTFSEVLKEKMKEKSISISDLAFLANIQQRIIQEILDKEGFPSRKLGAKIAKALSCLSDLFKDLEV